MALPTTGFENRNLDGAWTTFAEEDAYLSELLAEVPQVREEVIGQGATGLDIRMFKVGTGARHMLLVAQVHADELSGRDALLSMLRDWSTTSDTTLQGYLEEVTLLVIPTARPDSQTDRENANGVNVNRDHVQLTQPETRAIHRAIRDYSPEVMVDLHEGRNISNQYATSKTLNPNVAPGIAGLSEALEQHVRGAIEGAGWTWEAYQAHNIYGPEYGHNAFSLRHGVGLLLESMRVSSGGNIVDTERRYQSQVTALNAILEWHATNLNDVETATTASGQWATSVDQIHLAGGTNSSWTTIDAADGYRVYSSSAPVLADVTDLYGLAGPNEQSVIDTRNANRVIAHYVLDSRSPQSMVNGRPYDEDEDSSRRTSVTPTTPELLFKTGGRVHTARFRGAASQPAPPQTPVVTYEWANEPHASESIKRVDGIEAARNLMPDPEVTSLDYLHAGTAELTHEGNAARWTLAGATNRGVNVGPDMDLVEGENIEEPSIGPALYEAVDES